MGPEGRDPLFGRGAGDARANRVSVRLLLLYAAAFALVLLPPSSAPTKPAAAGGSSPCLSRG